MSFSVDLWDGFDVIKTGFSLNQRSVKQLFDILTSYSLLQKEYCKGLENIIKEIKESKELQNPNSLLDESLNLLMSSFIEEEKIYKAHYENINKNITELNEELDKIKTQINPYFTENLQNIESFNQKLNILITKQNEYNNSCNELCFNLADAEASKMIKGRSEIKENQENKTNEKDINDNKKKKNEKIKDNPKENKENEHLLKDLIEDKNSNLLLKVIEIKNEYINYIEETEKEREKFNKKTEDLLNNLQKQFRSLIYLFQNAIHNYAKDKTNTYNTIIELIKDNNKNYYSKINYKTETLNFITKNVTKMFPMNKIEFFPYKLNKNEIVQKLAKYNELSKKDQNDIFNNIKNYIKEKKIIINDNEFINIISHNLRLSSNNSKTNKNRNPALVKKENLMKSNFIFINDFVFKLCNSNEITKLNKQQQQNISDESFMYNNLLFRFLDLISVKNADHFDYLQIFVKVVSYYRSKGFFILNESSYKVLVNIFSFILVNYKTSNNIIKNIILFGQTFYRVDEKTKNRIYILTGLKNHDSFNDVDVWHRVINYNLSVFLKNNNTYSLSIANKEEYIKNLNKIAVNSIISYLYDLKLSTNKDNIYEEVKNFYVNIYGLDKDLVETQVENLFRDSNKENDNKKDNKEENKNIIVNKKENEIEKKIENIIIDNKIENNINENKNEKEIEKIMENENEIEIDNIDENFIENRIDYFNENSIEDKNENEEEILSENNDENNIEQSSMNIIGKKLENEVKDKDECNLENNIDNNKDNNIDYNIDNNIENIKDNNINNNKDNNIDNNSEKKEKSEMEDIDKKIDNNIENKEESQLKGKDKNNIDAHIDNLKEKQKEKIENKKENKIKKNNDKYIENKNEKKIENNKVNKIQNINDKKTDKQNNNENNIENKLDKDNKIEIKKEKKVNNMVKLFEEKLKGKVEENKKINNNKKENDKKNKKINENNENKNKEKKGFLNFKKK